MTQQSEAFKAVTENVAALLLAVGSLSVVTCSLSNAEPAASPLLGAAGAAAMASPQAAPPGAPSATAVSAAASVVSTNTPSNSGALAPPAPEFASFWQSVDELSQGVRKEPVRVLWFGDSHTAADFWVAPLRQHLAQHFGVGGPGYIQIGLKAYRHGGAKVETGGKWRTVPARPSYFVKQQGDGIYGISGMRTVPMDEKAWASIALSSSEVKGPVRWQIVYRLSSPRSQFTAVLDGQVPRVVDTKAGSVRASGLSAVSFESDASATLRLVAPQWEPEIFGVFVEASAPGVVVDTLGINGARLETALTWSEAQFVAEVRARNPSLVVLAYGTNEIGDQLAPFRYGAQYDTLLQRLRAANPNTSCLIAGPTDRALPDWTSDPRGAAIDQVQREAATRNHCGFFSMRGAMGGTGAFQQWAFASPPLAHKDRVHLTIDGYTKLGESLADYLMGTEHSGGPAQSTAAQLTAAQPTAAQPTAAQPTAAQATAPLGQ
ncbi:MAG TPA: GDSL-type esterase/lipase family protein [Polyangiaceae bacterium]|jgi:lysophospholipase L1-like esterase|nr:GDSL-type esterase/lipase family protein [Polyangiaceae bacterium]